MVLVELAPMRGRAGSLGMLVTAEATAERRSGSPRLTSSTNSFEEKAAGGEVIFT